MANRIVQAIYDLKDNVTGKLKKIGDAWRGSTQDSDKAAAGAERGGKRLSAAYEGAANSIGKLRAAIGALAAVVGLQKLYDGLVGILNTGERFDDLRKQFDTAFGGIEEGGRALESVKALAKDIPNGFEDVSAAAIALKKFGFDPLDGTLQALIDNNAALDKSQEDLITTIDTLGKANLRGQINMRALIALQQQGIPVTELLGKALGKSEAEIKRMAATGQLGADAIKVLVRELGELRAGAAAAEMGDLDAQLQKIRDNANQFFNLIAQSGALAYFQERLAAVNTKIKELTASGELQRYAKSISDGIVVTGRAVEGAVSFIVKYSDGLLAVAKGYLAMKAAQASIGLLNIARDWKQVAAATLEAGTSATKSGGMFGKLGATIRGMPRTVQIGLIVAGYELLDLTANKIAEIAARNSDATEALEAANAARRAQVQEEINLLHIAQQQTIQFRDTQIKSATEVAALTDAEIAAYKARLEGAQEYARQQLAVALRQQEIRGATDETNAAVAEASKRLADVRKGWDNVAKGAELAGEAAAKNLSIGAAAVIDQLGKIDGATSAATSKIGELFKSFETASTTRLGDIALGLASVSTESIRADTNVRTGLAATLKKLGGEDLLRFQGAAQAAFEQFNVGAEQSAAVADTVLLTALERLGVKGDSLGVRFTAAGRDTIATFQAIAESSNATSSQIEAGFKAALAAVSTSAEAESLGIALEAAAARGAVALDTAERSAAALKARLREIQEAADPLSDAFARLGVTSQRELRNAADTAREAFDQIVSGAQRGQAATEDVRRAFVAYAKAQLDAVANSDGWERKQVEGAIRVRAASLNVRDALVELGLAGDVAGDKVAGGANRATAALQGTEDAASSAAAAASGLAASNVNVANTFVNVSTEANITSGAIDGVSEKFKQLISDTDLYQGGGAQIFFDLNEQSAELEKQIQLIRDQNAQYDELEMRVRGLRGQYELLSDDRLRQLAQEEMKLEENQRRAAEEAAKKKAEREAERRAPPRTEDDRPRTAAGSSGVSIAVNFDGATIIGEPDQRTAERLATLLARPLQAQLERIAARSR